MKNIISFFLLYLIIFYSDFCKAGNEILCRNESVDLGLSVIWSSCNLGASKSTDYGSCFSWGETEEKTLPYIKASYKWMKKNKLLKYCTNKKRGKIDNKNVLENSDDVAFQQLGGSWRIPTNSDFEELENNCEKVWYSNYDSTGVSGILYLSKINGKSIFLPACGYHVYGYYMGDKKEGVYWTSNLNTMEPLTSYYYYFDSSRNKIDSFSRYYGCYIRPVMSK